MSETKARPAMSRRTARLIVLAIIGLCLLAIVFIFQPVWRPLYSAGCVMVVSLNGETALPGHRHGVLAPANLGVQLA